MNGNAGRKNDIETFYGLVENTSDALRIFEMCRQGRLGRVRRRLHERERKQIRSGSVFVFSEEESGIRRWTDGRLWSPSRILGNFLIYRELERKIPAKLVQKDVNQGGGFDASGLDSFNAWWSAKPTTQQQKVLANNRGRFIFASDGLIKKTISTFIDGQTHHLIAYYRAGDFCCREPARFDLALYQEMRRTAIPVDLLIDQNFRKPEAALPNGNNAMQDRPRRTSMMQQTSPVIATGPMRGRRHSTTSLQPALSVASMLQTNTSDSAVFDELSQQFDMTQAVIQDDSPVFPDFNNILSSGTNETGAFMEPSSGYYDLGSFVDTCGSGVDPASVLDPMILGSSPPAHLSIFNDNNLLLGNPSSSSAWPISSLLETQ